MCKSSECHTNHKLHLKKLSFLCRNALFSRFTPWKPLKNLLFRPTATFRKLWLPLEIYVQKQWISFKAQKHSRYQTRIAGWEMLEWVVKLMCILCSESEHPKQESVVVGSVVRARILLTPVTALLVLLPVASVVGMAIGPWCVEVQKVVGKTVRTWPC